MRKIICLISFIGLMFIPKSSYAEVIHTDMDNIIEIGIRDNYDLKMRRMELKTYEKNIAIANRLKNPEIQSNIVTGNIAYGNASQAGVTLPIEILKRGARKQVAEKEYEIKQTELKRAEHNFKLQLMQAYFEVLQAKSVCAIQEERLKLFDDLVNITTDKPKTNNYEIDNLKADIQYSQQQIEVNRAKSNLLAKQFELNKLLNVTTDSNIFYDTEEDTLLGNWAFLKIKLPEYNFIENIALQYSYIVKISEQTISKREKELSYMKRQRIPDVAIGSGFSWMAHKELEHEVGGAYVGFGMNLPVLYTFTPDIEKAQIFLERSKVNKVAYENQLKYELKKDYNNFKYSAENMSYSKEILENSKKIVKLSMDGYISGKNSYTDLVINETGHQEVLSSYLSAMTKHFYSYLELMQDIGHDVLIEEDLL